MRCWNKRHSSVLRVTVAPKRPAPKRRCWFVPAQHSTLLIFPILIRVRPLIDHFSALLIGSFQSVFGAGSCWYGLRHWHLQFGIVLWLVNISALSLVNFWCTFDAGSCSASWFRSEFVAKFCPLFHWISAQIQAIVRVDRTFFQTAEYFIDRCHSS